MLITPSQAPTSLEVGACANCTPAVAPRQLGGGFLVVVVIALTVRLAHLSLYGSYEFLKYPSLAAILLRGGAHDPFNASPLYIYFWALMHQVFNYSAFEPRVLQLLLGSLSTGLLYLLATRYVRWPFALATGLTAAVYAPFIVHDGVFLSEFLVIFLNVAALVTFHRARERASAVWWAAGGVLWGLSAITRPNIMLLAPALVWWAGLNQETRRRNLTGAVIAVGLAGLFVLGITGRNWRVGGEAIPVMSDGGIVFYLANNELDRGLSPVWPRSEAMYALGQLDPTHRLAREITAQVLGHPVSISEASSYWLRQGLQFVRERPGQWLWLCGRKLWMFGNGYELSDTMAQYAVFSGLRGGWWVRLGLIAPLALLGLVVAARDWRRHLLLYGYVAVYVFTIILFGVESRYRLPAVPGLLVLAAVAAMWLGDAARSRRWGRLGPALVALALLGVSCNWQDYEIQRSEARLEINLRLFDKGAALVDKGKYVAAIPVLRQVVAEHGVYEAVVDACTLLAKAHNALGERAAAERVFQEGTGPLCTDTVLNLPTPPRADLERRLQTNREDVFALRDLGYVAWQGHDLATAERCFRRVILRAPSHAPGHFNLAVVRLAQGDQQRARHELDVALTLMPNMAPAQVLRATLR